MARGVKICDKCGSGNGPRAKICKKCSNHFVFKAKSKQQKQSKIISNLDWRNLQKGDKIKVNGGPYFIQGNESIPMGYRGDFVVDSLDNKGIRAFGVDKCSGFCHIYMGKIHKDVLTGILKSPHRIKKIVKKEKYA